MLDRTDFASWQQRIRLYCWGKENGVNILKSIDEGPYQMGTVRETLAESTEGAPQLGLERPRVYSDQTSEEKDRYNADIRATNILLQGLPKDIYTLINHYTVAKDIWDIVKILIEGSELTKEDQESQLYDDFEHFRQYKGESIHNYYVRFAKLINDMRNIKMTMSRLQLNSKFVNNMLPEWGRFVTAVKLNRGLRDSNYDQLYAYLKQHETHVQENKMMLERFSQPTVDPLALMSNVSNSQHYSSSSLTSSSSTQVPQPIADSSLSLSESLIENITNTLALLTQSYKTFLPQTNNQLQTSSNARNQATIQNGEVVVQNVQGRQNRGQGMNPQGGSATGYGGAQNRVGNVNLGHARPGQARPVKCYNCNGAGHIVGNYTQPKQPQNSKYFKDKMLLMQAQENGVALDKEQLLFLAGGQDNTFDDDVDEQLVQDLALNVDNVFQADDCDAFDSDMDEALTAQTMFMANLSSVDPVTDEARPSYDSDILSEVQDHDHYLDVVCTHHDEHLIHDSVQLNHVVDSHANYTSDSNMIPYDQYVKDNEVPVVQSNVSSVPNDTFMMIYNDIPKPHYNELNKVDIGYKNPLCLTRAKPVQPALYNGHEIIKDNHTPAIVHNTEDTLEIAEITRKKMNDKMNDPECVTRKVKISPHDYLKENLLATSQRADQGLQTNHTPAIVHNTEDTLEIAEITRKKMNDKMNDPECVTRKVKIAPHDYLKENFLATFTPRKQLTPEQMFWSNDLMKLKFEALKEQIKVSRPIKALTVSVFHGNKELNVARFTEMHVANTTVEARCLALEAELANLRDKSHHDNQEELINHFSRLERRHKFHPRLDSLLHLPNDEPVLGYLKSVQDSPAPKPTKPASKPKSTAHKEPPRPSASTPVTSAQPAPTSTPAKPQKKKRKQATETSDKPAKAKKVKYSAISKIRKPRSSLKYVAASEAEDVPAVKPQVADEDADYQKALEESMKTAYALPQGPLPPVVIREPESRKYQTLPEMPGNGKLKVTEKQVAHDLLSLQKAKKKSPVEQYIFQRRTFTTTGSSGQNEPSYAKLEWSESETTEKMGSDAGAQDETSEGQAGSNPDETFEGQAEPDPGNAGGEMQSISSLVVHAGSDNEHIDLDVVDVPPQPFQEQLDEGFTTMVYPKVQKNLKLTVEEQVLLEDPASSSGTLSSLQHLSKDISFGDLFFSDKPSEANNDKTTVEIKVESMVSQFKATTIETTTTTTLPPPTAQEQSTPEAMMMKRIGKLEHIMAMMMKRIGKYGARLYTLEQLGIPQQVSKAVSEVVTDAVDWAMQAPLRNRLRDLPKADMKKVLHQRIWETESYKSHEDHMQLFEALEKSMNRDHSEKLMQDLAEAHKRKKKMPPPPPPPSSTTQESPSKGSAAPSSSKTATSTEYQAWITTDVRLRPSISLTPTDLEIDEDIGLDEQAQFLDDEDIGSAHIPKVNLRQDWWKPMEEERPATPEPAWSISSSDAHVLTNNWASALASNYSPPHEDLLLVQTGDIATFIDWFCKRRGITELKPQDLEGLAFEIIKVFYPDVIRLQYQMEEFHKLLTDSVDDPILRHNVSKPLPLGGPPGQISSGLKKSENTILLQCMVSLTGGSRDNDSTLIDTHLKVIAAQSGHICGSLVLNESKSSLCMGVQMLMRFNEIHKYSDDTLQQMDEALDYRVKEFQINRINPSLNTRFWTRWDVDRSRAFMFAIQKRLKTRRIFRNLESFVGGRVREGDYRVLKRTE
nr:hypothetical protein [Tanacetum cinerariifolium]